MKKTLVIAIIPALIISLTGLTSCKNRSAESEQKKIEQAQIQTIPDEIKKNVYPIPNSAYIINLLADYGVSYEPTIPNSYENVKKYLNISKRAQNLGAYGADLSYATLYNNQQEVINYLSAIRSLANDLNMPKIYDESLYNRIKINVDKKDSLVAILTDAFNNTYAYLSDNDQLTLGLLVVGGAWVEGMHLTSHVSGKTYNNAAILKVLLKQKETFEQYLEITKPYLTDPNLGEFVKWLEPMKQAYAGLSTSLTPEQLSKIKKAIEGIRSKIVQ